MPKSRRSNVLQFAWTDESYGNKGAAFVPVVALASVLVLLLIIRMVFSQGPDQAGKRRKDALLILVVIFVAFLSLIAFPILVGAA